MKGKIASIRTSVQSGREYGFIKGEDDSSYYFDSRSLSNDKKMTDYYEGDIVEFSVLEKRDGKKSAYSITYIEPKIITPTDKLSVNIENKKS
ncbi:MAG TPA: cold shock domain-containing protein [Oscillospiraceae bacterium]|nr:cold shock domain-containing protein [Oscillospiraceae bacterium]HPF55085.1 cold shock domain-containing protein [Clostridiales bacterium]HPK34426.1 cold shock domain-containing protein [Oscillospiraceae bacterium]HPR75589.1 cold shock domain-containing protein [Oscillospiraceae bacterium]